MKNLVLAVIFTRLTLSSSQAPNVCKEFSDYYLKFISNNCYYNPDLNDDIPDITERHNLKLESYTVRTEDGYELTMFRIPSTEKNAKIVFLQHGILLSSMTFVNIGEKSLAILLAKSGYDVWLGNFRGTRYSINHFNLSTNSRQYWNFSFHELGVHDVKEQINFISEKTGSKENIIYIGFSLGTTASFVYSIIYPELARKNLKVIISLAPVAYLSNLQTPIGRLAPMWKQIEWKVNEYTNGVLFKLTPDQIAFLKLYCTTTLHGLYKCKSILQSIFGFDYRQWDPETLPVTLIKNLEPVSTKVASHYFQVSTSNDFKYFDYGRDKNMETYGMETPPKYNLSKIKVPIYIIHSENDQIATTQNVERLYDDLPDEVKIYGKHKVPYTLFSHDDFVSARNVDTLLYNDLIKFINETL